MNPAEQLKEKLKDKHRRLTSGKLYKIKDKHGKIIPFIPNETQMHYINNKHNLNVIVKARQLGFSTMIDIDGFDDVLFNRGFTFGIIADTKDIALEIFRDKIQVLRDNLPDWLKNYYEINTQRANELSFENTGSRVSVSNSYRGGTLQRLHISEFGKICSKYPLKAKEIVTGALETVAIGQIIDIESTAMGAEGAFYNIAKTAKETQELGGDDDLNQLQYKLFFFPRWKEKKYRLEANVQMDQETDEYFEKVYNDNGIELTEEQEKWYYMKKQTLLGDIFREYPSTFEEAFSMNIEGAYYETELKVARLQGRIGMFPYDANLQVNTAWDLGGWGGGDDTSIWFFQIFGGNIRVIDYWDGNGRSIIDIIQNVVLSKDYNYGTHYGPHDLKVTHPTGETTYTIADKAGIRFEILPKMGISDGIQLVRSIFSSCFFHDKKCAAGLSKLSRYRRKFDDRNGVWIDKPMKNGADHCADAFRYLATALSYLVKEKQASLVMKYDLGE